MSEKKFSKKHEWVSLDGDTATVGITKHATEMLGDIVFVEVPEPGKSVEKDGQAPHDPELAIQFHEDRWICHLPPLVALERQLSIQLAEGLRRLEPSQLHVLTLVVSKRSIASRQLSDAIPHFGSERRCAEAGFTKERKVMLCAISSISSKVTADSLVRDKSIRIAG